MVVLHPCVLLRGIFCTEVCRSEDCLLHVAGEVRPLNNLFCGVAFAEIVWRCLLHGSVTLSLHCNMLSGLT